MRDRNRSRSRGLVPEPGAMDVRLAIPRPTRQSSTTSGSSDRSSLHLAGGQQMKPLHLIADCSRYSRTTLELSDISPNLFIKAVSTRSFTFPVTYQAHPSGWRLWGQPWPSGEILSHSLFDNLCLGKEKAELTFSSTRKRKIDV